MAVKSPRSLRILGLLSDCLLKAMAAEHEDSDNVNERGGAKDAMDLLYFSNPRIIEWLHEITAYRPCAIYRSVQKVPLSSPDYRYQCHQCGKDFYALHPHAAPDSFDTSVKPHTRFYYFCTRECVNRWYHEEQQKKVAGGSTPVRPDATDLVNMKKYMDEGRIPEYVLRVAHLIACAAHYGQTGRYGDEGQPYINHVARVVSKCSTDEERSVAWLHDVLEDTPITVKMLLGFGIPEHIIGAVLLLTRSKNEREVYGAVEEYRRYIDRLCTSKNRLALTVKLADLDDHLREQLPGMQSPAAKQASYKCARIRVMAALNSAS